MKNLNKKGFTLVELLAVVIILAILIVVVATVALPAMQGAKEDALETYAKRVSEKAKEYVMIGNDCSKGCSVETLMGANDQYDGTIKVTGDAVSGFVITEGTVNDKNNNLTATITNGVVTVGATTDASK